MVDFPAPDEPSSAAVKPGCSQPFNGSTDCDYLHSAGNASHSLYRGLHIRANIGFIQYHHGPRSTLPRQDQIAFNPPQVEIPVQPANQETQINVGRHALRRVRASNCSPHEGRFPLLHGFDEAKLIGRSHSHPVSNGRQLTIRPQSARWYRRAFHAAGQQHPIFLARIKRHSPFNKFRFRHFVRSIFKGLEYTTPAQPLDGRIHSISAPASRAA
jgi:hypothetical protein